MGDAPGLVLVGGRIHTLGNKRPVASSIAFIGGRIVYVGDDASEARRMVHGETVDLRGACIIPGLTDAHLHFQDFSLGLERVDAASDKPEVVVARVAAAAAKAPRGSWILGLGWNQNLWAGIKPSAALLDGATREHPVALEDKSGHALWVNGAALAAAGIGEDTPDPADGRIVRDGAGKPTGLLLEGAGSLVRRHIPAPSADRIAEAMEKACAVAHRAGLTGIHDFDGPLALAAHQLLRASGRLSLRVLKSIPVELLDEALALGLRTGFGDELLRIGQVKMFSDGAMGPQTAWMLEDYEGAAGYRGICVTPTEEIRAAILKANSGGLACAVHAIGDRANREILNAYESVAAELGTRPRGSSALAALAAPNRIEHVQLLAPEDRPRLAALGVVASMQPIHATVETELTDRHWGSRGEGAYGFATQLRHGAVLAFGSDAPVETLAPLAGIHAAVTRRRADGGPCESGWYPKERLSVEEAVCAYTRGPALAAGMADRLGSLEAGKIADLTILAEDIFDMDPMGIAGATVLGTIVDGRFAWRHGSLD